MERRPRTYILFIDFAKAFDKVNRGRLLNKMIDMGFNQKLTRAIRKLITGTYMEVQGETVETELGVP